MPESRHILGGPEVEHPRFFQWAGMPVARDGYRGNERGSSSRSSHAVERVIAGSVGLAVHTCRKAWSSADRTIVIDARRLNPLKGEGFPMIPVLRSIRWLQFGIDSSSFVLCDRTADGNSVTAAVAGDVD